MSGYFSDDAESWTPVGEHTVSGTITEVRLIAGRAQLEPAVAEFDYFTLSPQGTATDATPATVSTQSSAIPATHDPAADRRDAAFEIDIGPAEREHLAPAGSGHRRQSHEHGQLGIPLPLPGWRK